MNILHLKYAVEVERMASITKAAENLYMGQPHLSRSIKDLEETLGIKIFKRTAKGIIPTARGAEFLQEAKNILARIDSLQQTFSKDMNSRIDFSVSIPRSEYISKAFAETVAGFDEHKKISVNYKETNTTRTIENVLQGIYKFGIVRVEQSFYYNVLAILNSYDFKFELLACFDTKLLVHKNHNFSEMVTEEELKEATEITYGDLVPVIAGNTIKKNTKNDKGHKKIMMYERASFKYLLKSIPNSYMWEFDVDDDTLEHHDLEYIQHQTKSSKHFLDVLIFKAGTRFSDEENVFIENVKKHKDILLS